MPSSGEKRTCPCKKLPWSLSSFTAAEYGDLHTLSTKLRKDSNVAFRVDSAGYTPLHYAAQHGHVAATSLLVNAPSIGQFINQGPATPLHRASFAGAVSTMRLLLQVPEIDLLIPDTSFGDNRTALHKAAAGGRYLAVQLLLQAATEKKLLSQALHALDSSQQTPLQVAREMIPRQEQERASVARWDAVAGGVADWEICVRLLEKAEQQQQQPSPTLEASQSSTINKTRQSGMKPLPSLPTHLTTIDGCMDCGADTSGTCLTASWQAAFQKALGSSVSASLVSPGPLPKSPTATISDGEAINPSISSGTPSQPKLGDTSEQTSNSSASTQVEASSHRQEAPVGGAKCANCGKVSIALYPVPGRILVCKACKRNMVANNGRVL